MRAHKVMAGVVTSLSLAVVPSALPQQVEDLSDQELYEIACGSCHGPDGTGVDPTQVAFTVPVPDLTQCSFASREPDADWIAVAHAGGPVRGFDETMPAFGDALSVERLQGIIDYIRTFCTDDRWPRGELNLPRPLITEKAYPEDEAVSTVTVNTEGPGAVMNELLYERRFGALFQIELKLPVGVREQPTAVPGGDGDWNAGIGDVTVGLKRVLFHSLESGSILSLGAEATLPTGSESKGFGTGTTMFESFLAFGQILPSDAFLHAQGIVEISTDTDRANHEVAWRAVVGQSWTQGEFGRTWTPMIELLGSVDLDQGASAQWSALPQVQVTLNTRQHVMANLGVRVPLNDTDLRSTQILFYILWDWFDGGFFGGW